MSRGKLRYLGENTIGDGFNNSLNITDKMVPRLIELAGFRLSNCAVIL